MAPDRHPSRDRGRPTPDQDPDALTLHVGGGDEVVVRGRYEALSIVNDILIAVWFIVGSVLFFSEDTTVAGTWAFLLGSVQLLIRPVIRLGRRVHLRRLGQREQGSGTGSRGPAGPGDGDDEY
ncbi:YrhK family protein [Frigoribacterium salinisoli]